MPRLEDFQRGTPLNDELKLLKEGALPEAAGEQPEAWRAWEPEHTERALTEAEREDLARLTREPGWRVLQRLRKRTLLRMERAAIVASENNPLGRAQEIAEGWANLAAFKHQMRMDELNVQAEMQGLKKQGSGDASVLD
jgi:hypothetical protein